MEGSGREEPDSEDVARGLFYPELVYYGLNKANLCERGREMMDFWKDLATIATPLVLGGGFYFAWRQFDAMRRTRMAELIMSLCDRWDSTALEEARQELNKIGAADQVKEEIIKADKDNSENLYPLVRIGNFYDSVGILVHEGFLDKDIAYELMGTAFETYYGLYSGILRDSDYKDFFKCFKELDGIFTKIKAGHSKTKARSA